MNTIHRLIEEKQNVYEIVSQLEQCYRTHPANALARIATLVNIPFRYNPDGLRVVSHHQTDKGALVFEIEKETQAMFDNKISEYRRSGKSQQLAEIYNTSQDGAS